jgi:hypothetical protein
MRGTDTKQASMLSLLTPEKRVPSKHPLRLIKQMAETALEELSPLFDSMLSRRSGGIDARPTVEYFHKEKRSNATHESTTDPEARLARKGKGKPRMGFSSFLRKILSDAHASISVPSTEKCSSLISPGRINAASLE